MTPEENRKRRLDRAWGWRHYGPNWQPDNRWFQRPYPMKRRLEPEQFTNPQTEERK